MYLYTVNLVYWQLLLYGVHVGHSFINSIIFSAWLVYSYRQNILIINLFKTVLLFKNGYTGLNSACQFSGPIWFINLHRSVELFLNYSAKQCGEFCYTSYWIHGLISNWVTLANTFLKLNRMVKSANKGQFAKLELDSSPLVLGRYSWPRASFVSSVFTSPHPTKESLYLGIPCLAIVDTNVSGHIANIAIPGNDDSLDCVVFYNTHVSQYILDQKYANISGWFFNIRKNLRSVKFFDWIFVRYINWNGRLNEIEVWEKEKKRLESMEKKQKLLEYKVSYDIIRTYGLDFFFSRNCGLDNHKEQLDLYEPVEVDFDIDLTLSEHRLISIFLTKTINYYIIKSSWRFNNFVKKRTLTLKLFQRRFLVGFYATVEKWKITNAKNYMRARFYVNRFYKTHLRYNNLRPNKFILRFLKFYFIKRFMSCRGFVSLYNSNWMQVSSLAYVAISQGSRLFMNELLPPLLQYGKGNFFVFKHKILNKNLLFTWSFFISGMKNYLISILTKSNIKNDYKFSLKWSMYIKFKYYLRKNIRSFFRYYKCFFNFFLWNREVRKGFLREYNIYSLKVWKVIKGIHRNYIYFQFLQKADVLLNSFLSYYYKNCINKNKLIKNKLLVYFFKLVSKYYKKNLFMNTRNFLYNLIYKHLRKCKRTFAKLKKTRFKAGRMIMSYNTKRIPHSIYYKGRKPLRKRLSIVYFHPPLMPKNIFFPRWWMQKNKRVNLAYKIKKKDGSLNHFKQSIFKDRHSYKALYWMKNKTKFRWYFKFTNNSINKFNLIYSSVNANIENKIFENNFTYKFFESFFSNTSRSTYRFDFQVSRYCIDFFYRWSFCKRRGLKYYKYFKYNKLKKVNSQRQILIYRKICTIQLREIYFKIFKKTGKWLGIPIKVYNLFLLGNVKFSSSFIDRFWLYSKKNFYYPFFFYIDNVIIAKFKMLRLKTFSFFSRCIIKTKKKKKVLAHFILPYFFRMFSLYNKYFFSYIKSCYPFNIRVNQLKKKSAKRDKDRERNIIRFFWY